MKNNIKEILRVKSISVNELSRQIESPYAFTHALVNRDSLGATQLDTLIRVSKVLDVSIETLYSDEGAKEVEIVELFNDNYAGGLAVTALREYKKEIEKDLGAKLDRYVVASYSYESKIEMDCVEDELRLELIIGDKKSEDDRYSFYFKGKSVQLMLKNRLIDSIENCINEYENGNYANIEELYNDLNNENMYPNLIELVKIELETITMENEGENEMSEKLIKELEELKGEEFTLLEMDNVIQNILGVDAGSIFEGDTENFIEDGQYSYTTWADEDKEDTVDINIHFEVLEENEVSMDVLVKIVDVEEL